MALGRRRVILRPDMLCERHDALRVVLDAKWKSVGGPDDLSAADKRPSGEAHRATPHLLVAVRSRLEELGGERV